MQSADLSLIKEIPGYQIIMKAVLKHQIQQLVEQLSETTGEESILLTASVSDGSLSHLGSESGRSFLDGHNEIKSQFLGYVLKSHHTKKTEKQFASGPGRKTATVPLSYEDSIDGGSYNEASYTELQQDTIPPPAITPTKPGAKRKKPAKKAPTPVEIKVRPKRSAAAMKSPLKSDIYVGENDDIEEISESEQEQADSVEIEMVTGEKDDAAEYTEIVPVSDPIPVVPKVDTEDLLLAQGGDSHSIMENIIVKKEAELDYEAGTMEDEEDPDWEPGTKKRRKSSGSRSLASPVNVTATRSLASPVNVGGEQAQNDKSTFMCSYCGKMYSSAVNLRRHQQIHEEPQHCHCGAIFTTKEALKEHENAKHKSLYFCKKCPNLRRFSSRSGLFAHNVKAHKADTSLKCEICDRRFGQLGHLKDHMNAHSDEAKYECNCCGSKFKFHTSLRNHEKICTGEVVKRGLQHGKSKTIPLQDEIYTEQFSKRMLSSMCTLCTKMFASPSHLAIHMRVHTGARPFECEQCHMTFNTKGNWKRHMIKHL